MTDMPVGDRKPLAPPVDETGPLGWARKNLFSSWGNGITTVVLIAFVVSLRKVSANIRAILLRAVHGRIEATRLASELDTALETMQHGLCMLDENGLIAVANDRAELVFSSFMPGNWAGRPFAAIVDTRARRSESRYDALSFTCCSDHTTSAGVSGSPLWNVTPSRSVNV